jgi:chemotaxis protein methyltransferase CheR
MLTNCKTGEYDSLAIGRGLSPSAAALLRPERAGALGDQGADQNRVEFRSFNLLDSYASWASSTSCSAATC